MRDFVHIPRDMSRQAPGTFSYAVMFALIGPNGKVADLQETQARAMRYRESVERKSLRQSLVYCTKGPET